MRGENSRSSVNCYIEKTSNVSYAEINVEKTANIPENRISVLK